MSLDSLIYAQASRLKKIPDLGEDAAAQLEEVFMEVPWPPKAGDFDGATYRRETIERGLGKGTKSWPGSSREERLDRKVMKECGTSPDDLRKLDESQKIDLLVEKRRALCVSPLERISEFTETFRAFVAYPITLDEVARVVKTIVAMAHGDSLLTIGHCALLDARVLLRRREQYLEAEEMGEIGNLENFYSPGNQKHAESQEVGKKLTRTLMKASDLPECLKVDRGRISLIGESDAKLHVDSLLTATAVVRCVVLLGAVKDVENTKEAAAGRIVVTCLIEGEPWHVLCNPSHLAMMNPLTPFCLSTLFRKFAPTLALGYRQDTSLVPPIKMVESGDGGVIVGNNSEKGMKANVKWATSVVVAQLDTVMARAVKVIGENNITDAPARLLARRVASASSGKLARLESRDDGLPDGFGVDVDALTKLIDSMKGVVDISKAVGPLGHILCSCPKPDPTPAPAPAPRPTNVNDTDPRNGWADDEWDQFAQQHG